MGNILGVEKKRPLTIHDLSVKIGEYRTINEGDPEMKEDPEFPRHMMKEALDKNNTIEGSVVQGTYVYYPNKRRPKMWIGNYKILNPEDILCEKIANSIGMTQEEWKSYIELKKQGDTKLDGLKTGEYPTFDMCTMDKNQIQELLDKQNIDYTYEQAGAEYPQARYDQHYFPTDTLVEPVMESSVYRQPEPADEPSYYSSANPNDGEIYNNEEYVNRLNREAERMRREQEMEIERERKDIFSYTSSSQYENDLLQYIKSGENAGPAQKSTTDSLSLSPPSSPEREVQGKARGSQGSPLAEELYDQKKRSLPSKGHPTLASMSTKASFVITESDASKKKIPQNHHLRKAIVH